MSTFWQELQQDKKKMASFVLTVILSILYFAYFVVETNTAVGFVSSPAEKYWLSNEDQIYYPSWLVCPRQQTDQPIIQYNTARCQQSVTPLVNVDKEPVSWNGLNCILFNYDMKMSDKVGDQENHVCYFNLAGATLDFDDSAMIAFLDPSVDDPTQLPQSAFTLAKYSQETDIYLQKNVFTDMSNSDTVSWVPTVNRAQMNVTSQYYNVIVNLAMGNFQVVHRQQWNPLNFGGWMAAIGGGAFFFFILHTMLMAALKMCMGGSDESSSSSATPSERPSVNANQYGYGAV